jgi:hypothetical protein
MNPILFVLLALVALSSYAYGHLLSFKERYKEWHKKLFKNGVKPVQWSLSRQTNRDRYKLSRRILLTMVTVFLVVTMLCLEDMTIPLWLYIIILAIAAVAPEILGSYYGKRCCDKRVSKQCTKHGMDIPEL